MTLVARCVHGLEWVCAAEIAALPGVGGVTLGRREVVFDLPSVHSGLPALSSVDDVFLRVGEVPAGTTKADLAALAAGVAGRPWAEAIAAVRAVRAVPQRPRFDVVASLEGRRTYNRFAVEEAVGAALAPRWDAEFVPRPAPDPDLTVRVFVRGPAAIAALRLGNRPLHRREYKRDTGPGTLHPPLAAALGRLADPAPGALVLDPFCGDGTIAIETASAYPDARVAASDLDPARVANATANARRAGVRVALSVADAFAGGCPPYSVFALVTNPPWNLVVDAGGRLAGSLDRFWRRVPGMLARDGRLCLVADANLEVPDTLRGLGFAVGLATRVRLAGRVSDLVLAGVPRTLAPAVPATLAHWRDRAVAAGVVTEEGF